MFVCSYICRPPYKARHVCVFLFGHAWEFQISPDSIQIWSFGMLPKRNCAGQVLKITPPAAITGVHNPVPMGQTCIEATFKDRFKPNRNTNGEISRRIFFITPRGQQQEQHPFLVVGQHLYRCHIYGPIQTKSSI
jgi:hypothetical protein